MSLIPRRHRLLLALAAVAVLLAGLVVALRPAASSASSLGQLKSKLGADQAHQASLAASLGSLDQTIDSLDTQISLVRRREATVTDALDADRAEEARVKQQQIAERARLTTLRHQLADARSLLGAQLRSQYETARPDLMTVVLQAHGFNQLLNQLSFLGDAENEQQTVIDATATAKREATATAARLARLHLTDTRVTRAAAVRADALAGMNALLQSKQTTLARARAAQADALAATRAHAGTLRQRISSIEARRAAARRAAARRAAAARAAAAAAAAQQAAEAEPTVPTALGSDAGWAIPYAVVLCESGGQNLPPNSAGASGYYQIIPSTWQLFGGSGPAAYLASKAQQSAVAAKIWDGGAGAHNWVCAGIVGID